jgi:ankyrin repeat protein
MSSLRGQVKGIVVIVTFLLSQHFALADDDFNQFVEKIYQKDLQGVKELIAKGADVNVREKTMGSTPLIVACSMEGTHEIVELLISKGADVNIIATYDGRTALMWAAGNSQKSVELLLEKGAKVNVKGVEGMTAFIQAIYGIMYGSVTTKVCDLLLAKGADINAQLTGPDATGWTALLFACSNDKSDLVNYLLSKKADVNLKAKDGTTALSIAKKNNHEGIIKALKSKGAKE